MSDNVITLADHRPHKTGYAACMECGADWVAVVPEAVTLLECYKCGAEAGEMVRIRDVEWFVRFMRGGLSPEDRNYRTLVILNAARMDREGI